MRRRGLDLAALDARDDLGDLRVCRRGNSGRGALARDEAVHRVDLRAPALEDVLRHRGPLDVAARIATGFRRERGLGLREGRGVAFGGAREALRLDPADLLQRVAERLAHAHRLAGGADGEAADLPVAP